MQSTLIWTGIEYYSLEHCLAQTGPDANLINSVIVGVYEQKPYRVSYEITTDHMWRTMEVKLQSFHHNQHLIEVLTSDGKGNWKRNGEWAEAYEGCIDVDLPLTPFTNTLPIKRLKMVPGEEQLIKVIYLDVLANEFRVVNQQYRRVSESTYHYENIPNDFEADIAVDEAGFVENYPQLFKRTIKTGSNFRFNSSAPSEK